MMGSPEDKERHRMRIRSRIAKSLEQSRYRQKIKDAKKKPIRELSHREFVDLLQEKEETSE